MCIHNLYRLSLIPSIIRRDTFAHNSLHKKKPQARILSIVDSYAAMTESRPYRCPYTPEEAATEIRRCAGSAYDPCVVEAFLLVLHKKSGLFT
ncbi:HD-GYP domain-containing protein [Dictyobacter alpinus]|uniref:HD-GYP domain-containing protein n=1 Tax=Dictyobacter alpinus TaxID=2014873 RepID=UPI003530C2AE